MKIAVVASGWHFPLHFFRAIAEQELPEGWSQDLFCVSHRDPKYSAEEKAKIIPNLGWSYRETLDRILYEKIATPAEIEALGWKYMLEPNTIGDWGNTNQWLEKYDYKKYDMLLITHDDNLILKRTMYAELLSHDPKWLILTNSKGQFLSWREWFHELGKTLEVRGSFEFVKPEVLDMIGGKFDLSPVKLTREGEVHSTPFLGDWNGTVRPLKDFFDARRLYDKVVALSTFYRISEWCIEGERGFISYSRGRNPKLKGHEDIGFARLERLYQGRAFKNW